MCDAHSPITQSCWWAVSLASCSDKLRLLFTPFLSASLLSETFTGASSVVAGESKPPQNLQLIYVFVSWFICTQNCIIVSVFIFVELVNKFTNWFFSSCQNVICNYDLFLFCSYLHPLKSRIIWRHELSRFWSNLCLIMPLSRFTQQVVGVVVWTFGYREGVFHIHYWKPHIYLGVNIRSSVPGEGRSSRELETVVRQALVGKSHSIDWLMLRIMNLTFALQIQLNVSVEERKSHSCH